MDDVIYLDGPAISSVNCLVAALSTGRKQVLLHLAKEYKSNKYQLGKKLKKHHSTVVYDFIKPEMDLGLVELCGSRVQERNKNKTTDEYRLTNKGLESLVSYYYDDKSLKNTDLVSELKDVFLNARKYYPEVILDVFRDLPYQYCLIFYPYFEEWKDRSYWKKFFSLLPYEPQLTKYLKLLTNHKINNDKKRIVVNNTFFQRSLPITEKERKLISEFIDREHK